MASNVLFLSIENMLSMHPLPWRADKMCHDYYSVFDSRDHMVADGIPWPDTADFIVKCANELSQKND